MRIRSFQLYNFRQFYGETPKIEFSFGEKNTTVIHGSNGAGKTALLNALTWTFYESFSPGFLVPTHLVNKRAIREAQPGEKVDAWVEIEFEHEDRSYSVKRSTSILKTQDEDGSLPQPSSAEIQWSGPDGKWNRIENTDSAIGRILPKALHGYFFFDGERIEKMVSPDKKESERLGAATKMFLGVEPLDRAERHLTTVRKEFESRLKAIGDPETTALLEDKAVKEIERDNLLEEEQQLDANLEGETARKKAISARLSELEEAKELERKRENLNRDKKLREESQKQNIAMLKDELSRHAYAVFLSGSAHRFLELLDALRSKGDLPAGIKVNFVDQLLEAGKCICGTCLNMSNPHARELVQDWKSRAGLADVEEKAIHMRGEITRIQMDIDSFWSRIDDIQKKRQSNRQELARIEAELDEISAKLRNPANEEASKLEEQRTEAEENIRKWERRKAINSHRIEQLRLEIDELDRKITSQESKEVRQELARRRVKATTEAIQVIIRVRSLLERQMRKSLQKQISDLFNQISVTPYVPELTNSYTLHLLESAGGRSAPVAASQGENQILSFSFIGAIVRQAKEWNEKHTALPGPNSSQYPIVMDSPFGALDPTYRRHIAEHLNMLADQVVLLLTKTQWRGEVETALQNKVSRQYVITYNTPRDDVEPDYLTIEGQRFELVRESPNEFEFSTIQPA